MIFHNMRRNVKLVSRTYADPTCSKRLERSHVDDDIDRWLSTLVAIQCQDGVVNKGGCQSILLRHGKQGPPSGGAGQRELGVQQVWPQHQDNARSIGRLFHMQASAV